MKFISKKTSDRVCNHMNADHKDSVEKAFNYAMEKCVFKSQIKKNSDLISRIYYKAD